MNILHCHKNVGSDRSGGDAARWTGGGLLAARGGGAAFKKQRPDSMAPEPFDETSPGRRQTGTFGAPVKPQIPRLNKADA